MDGHLHISGIEGLILHGAPGSSVYGISHIGAPARNIEEIHAVAHLLIRSKSNLYGSVGNFRMGHENFSHGDNFSNTGLVVSAQKRGSVCSNKVHSHIVFQIRENLRTHMNIQSLI